MELLLFWPSDGEGLGDSVNRLPCQLLALLKATGLGTSG